MKIYIEDKCDVLLSFNQTEQFKGVLKEVLNNPRECKCADPVLQGPGQSQGEEILWHYCVPVIFPFTAGVGEGGFLRI